jgi:hypothetical protein
MQEYGSVESLIRSALGSRFNESAGMPKPKETAQPVNNMNFDVNEMVAGYPDMSAFNAPKESSSNSNSIKKKYVFNKDIDGMFDCKVTINLEITPK